MSAVTSGNLFESMVRESAPEAQHAARAILQEERGKVEMRLAMACWRSSPGSLPRLLRIPSTCRHHDRQRKMLTGWVGWSSTSGGTEDLRIEEGSAERIGHPAVTDPPTSAPPRRAFASSETWSEPTGVPGILIPAGVRTSGRLPKVVEAVPCRDLPSVWTDACVPELLSFEVIQDVDLVWGGHDIHVVFLNCGCGEVFRRGCGRFARNSFNVVMSWGAKGAFSDFMASRGDLHSLHSALCRCSCACVVIFGGWLLRA